MSASVMAISTMVPVMRVTPNPGEHGDAALVYRLCAARIE
jgi:hypothetical protein